MRTNEFLKMTSTVLIDEVFINQIEALYNCALSEELKRILSSCGGETLFLESEEYDTLRILSRGEIIEAANDLGVNFIELKLIPLMDKCDNDFLVYDLSNKHWCLFNIADETIFRKKQSLSEYL